MNKTSRSVLIPWSWSINPPPKLVAKCPSPNVILVTFTVINILTTIFAVLLGDQSTSRKILRFISFNRLGKQRDDTSPKVSTKWKFMWLGPLALTLAANGINAWITVRMEGYAHARMPAIWDLTLFYMTRPRIGWLALSLLMTKEAEYNDKKILSDGNWTAAARQAQLAEIVLQLLATYYMGRTAHFGASRGYFHPENTDRLKERDALRMMIGGALMYMIYTLFSSVLLLLMATRHEVFMNRERDSDNLAGPVELIRIVACSVPPWIASWVFMVGYVRLAAELSSGRYQIYCPPDLFAQGFVWVAFSAVGSFLGGSI